MYCLINGISHDGRGVTRLNGKVVFVPRALPGEEVDVEIVEDKKNFAQGRMLSLISASPERADAPCRYYGVCGGCDYQHASYPLQLELKTAVVQQTLRRLGGLDIETADCIASPKPWRYRNKVTWHAAHNGREWRMGYYQSLNKQILPVRDCPLISESMQSLSEMAASVLKFLPESLSPLEIVIRESNLSKKLMLIAFGSGIGKYRKRFEETLGEGAALISVENNRVTAGPGDAHLLEKLGGIKFRLSPLTFFQVNHGQAEKLVDLVRGVLDLQGGEEILDAYCGAGTLALNLTAGLKRVIGVESFAGAIEDAQQNAVINEISNCRFISGSSEEILPTFTQRFDAVILDPPRSGCHPKVIESIGRQKIRRVVYVSCEPSTLARDLAAFKQVGYRASFVQPLDMFPQTRHVETVVLITRV